jgi:hypothetical protein
MRSHLKKHRGSGEAFITEGFTNWRKSDRFQVHVGSVNSAHNQAWRNCQDLMKQKQHIDGAMHKQSHQVKVEYRIRLTAIHDCIRYLLMQGLAFRGHDENSSSSNKGNFIELVDFLVNHNETIREVWKNTSGNLKLTSPQIQKDIVRAATYETTKAIIHDLGDDFFAIMIDESRDISVKEQMVLNPRDSFFAFDKKKLIRLAEFYPLEFSPVQLLELDSQLENYILDVCSEDAFF